MYFSGHLKDSTTCGEIDLNNSSKYGNHFLYMRCSPFALTQFPLQISSPFAQ